MEIGTVLIYAAKDQTFTAWLLVLHFPFCAIFLSEDRVTTPPILAQSFLGVYYVSIHDPTY